MAASLYTDEERAAIAEWLTANGINPQVVSSRDEVSIRDGLIHFQQFVLTDDGHKQVDPGNRHEAWTKAVSAPCHVRPPAGLGISGA